MDDHRLSGQPPTIAAAAACLRDGRTTAVELVEQCLDVIARGRVGSGRRGVHLGLSLYRRTDTIDGLPYS